MMIVHKHFLNPRVIKDFRLNKLHEFLRYTEESELARLKLQCAINYSEL